MISSPSGETSATRSSGLPVAVLVVDDSEVFLAALRAVMASSAELELIGEAMSGEEGVALAGRLHPDLALVDVILPGIDGLETCRRLHGLEVAPFVVLCSVNDDPRTAGPGLPCSDDPFMPKAAISVAALLELWRHRPTGSALVGR